MKKMTLLASLPFFIYFLTFSVIIVLFVFLYVFNVILLLDHLFEVIFIYRIYTRKKRNTDEGTS